MSENKSPAGTFPAFPFALAVDGEYVTNDKLCTSATDGLGWLGKLVDAIGYLKARTPEVFVITTDGAGAVTLQRRTPTATGAHMFSGVAFSGANTIRCTFTTALASAHDFCAQVTASNASDWIARAGTATTTHVDLALYDISVPGALDLTVTAARFYLAVWPELAGYT